MVGRHPEVALRLLRVLAHGCPHAKQVVGDRVVLQGGEILVGRLGVALAQGDSSHVEAGEGRLRVLPVGDGGAFLELLGEERMAVRHGDHLLRAQLVGACVDQLGGSLNSLAATIVPVLVGYLIGEVTAETAISDANPALFIAMGVFAVAFVIILFSYIPEPELEASRESSEPKESTMESVSKALSHKNLVFGVIAIFLYVGIEVGIPNIANLYMTSPEVGMSAGVAGTVVGMYWLLMLCGRLLGGVIGGKVSSKVMMTAVSSVAILFILVGMFLPGTLVKFPAISSDLSFALVDIPLGVVFFVLCGLCTSVMWGSIFNLAVEGLGKYTSIASGLFMTMVCGGGILPFIQGAVSDAFGYIDSFWVLIAALAYLLIFALFLSKPKVEEK